MTNSIEQDIVNKIEETSSFTEFFFVEALASFENGEHFIAEFICEELAITYPEIKANDANEDLENFDYAEFMSLIFKQYMPLGRPELTAEFFRQSMLDAKERLGARSSRKILEQHGQEQQLD